MSTLSITDARKNIFELADKSKEAADTKRDGVGPAYMMFEN